MDIDYKQISPKAIKVRNTNELISSLISVIIFAVLLLCTYQFHWWSWLQYVWLGLTDDFLYIKSGVWKISEVVVPMTKIQSIKLTQGVIMRKYGVSSVEIKTMQGSHAIPLVEDEVAKKLRDDISKLARLKELDE